jgi:hypothetical protein
MLYGRKRREGDIPKLRNILAGAAYLVLAITECLCSYGSNDTGVVFALGLSGH